MARQRLTAQRLILEACTATDLRRPAGKSLRYAVRCLLSPYTGHPDFRDVRLPRQGAHPAASIAQRR
ncbi:hypothetical protein [Streptomyces sp. NPDC050738]|uniref:hypothetical protein n=1 Tax=Streptomyces sp. NPDC050738 TaxID=3154744 RepID=UPI0034456CD7